MNRRGLLLSALAFGALRPGRAMAQTVAIEPRFETVGHFHEGLAPAKEGGLWGFIDRTGGWVVRPRFAGVRQGGDGRFGVKEGDRWGYVDSRGAVAIEPVYQNAGAFSGGVAAAQRDGRWGFITTTGAVETPHVFTRVAGREGRIFAAVGGPGQDADKWRVMRATAGRDPIISREDEYADPAIGIWDRDAGASLHPTKVHGFSEKAAVAVFDKGETLISEYGYPLVYGDGGPFFQSVRRRSEGWSAASRRKGVWGYVMDTGEFWDPGVLAGAREFSEGVAPVLYKGKWGYITKKAEWALEPRYDRAFSFHQGYATMRVGEGRGFLRLSDGVISEYIPPRFEDVFRFEEGFAPIKLGGLWGFVSNDERGAAAETRSVVDIIPE